MPKVKLNFINRSNDSNNSHVVIFSKNISTNSPETVAWKVINNPGHEDIHPFIYPSETYLGAADSWGNCTSQILAEPSQLFGVIPELELQMIGPASSIDEYQIVNQLDTGAINANIFKDGKLLASQNNIAPGHKAAFNFEDAIHIGVLQHEIVEGQVMTSKTLPEMKAKFSLKGIASADIVMTGGGPGRGSTPFEFALTNVIKL